MNDINAHARLNELFSEDPLDLNAAVADTTENPDELDLVVEESLSRTTLSALSPEAQELLLGLTETASSLEPGARAQFVAAADRGMKRRREDDSPLPRLLFLVRTRRNQSLDAVAAGLAADEDLLSRIERGESSVQEIDAERLADWIDHLGLPTNLALDALRRTFLPANASQAAAAAPLELSEEHHKFVDEVSDLLQRRKGS